MWFDQLILTVAVKQYNEHTNRHRTVRYTYLIDRTTADAADRERIRRACYNAANEAINRASDAVEWTFDSVTTSTMYAVTV